MAEYIERETLIEIARADRKSIFMCEAGFLDVAKLINSVHAADVAPVVHGQWIGTEYCGPHHMMIVQCSHCKAESEGSLNDLYCPHCGAKMDMK